MKKLKLTLFLALVIAVTTTSALADGQIPIGGRPIAEPVKITTPSLTSVIIKNDENSSPIKKYLWTFVDFIRQFGF